MVSLYGMSGEGRARLLKRSGGRDRFELRLLFDSDSPWGSTAATEKNVLEMSGEK